MFSNIGKKIKMLAKVLFWISFALGVLTSLGVAIAIANVMGCGRYYGMGAGAVFAAIGIFILGSGLSFLFSWISSFFMYGFGQLIDDGEINRKTNQKILAQLGGEPVPAEEPVTYRTVVTPVAPVAPVAPVEPEQPKQEGEWFCRNCGTKNDASAKFCLRCGTPNE